MFSTEYSCLVITFPSINHFFSLHEPVIYTQIKASFMLAWLLVCLKNIQTVFEETLCINHILKELWLTGHKSLLMFMAGPVMSLLIPNVVLFLLHDIQKLFFQGVVWFSSDVLQDILAILNLVRDALGTALMVVRLAKIIFCNNYS